MGSVGKIWQRSFYVVVALDSSYCCTGVDPSHRRWLFDVVKDRLTPFKEADLWAQLLGACAAHILGVIWGLPRLPRVDECALEDLALLVWLRLTCPELLEGLRLGERTAKPKSRCCFERRSRLYRTTTLAGPRSCTLR